MLGVPLSQTGAAALVFSVPHRSIVAEASLLQLAVACTDGSVSGPTTWRNCSVAAQLYEAAAAGGVGPAAALLVPTIAARGVAAAVASVPCNVNGPPAIVSIDTRAANWPPLSGGHSYAIALSQQGSGVTGTLKWLYSTAATDPPSAAGGLRIGGPDLAFVTNGFLSTSGGVAPSWTDASGSIRIRRPTRCA